MVAFAVLDAELRASGYRELKTDDVNLPPGSRLPKRVDAAGHTWKHEYVKLTVEFVYPPLSFYETNGFVEDAVAEHIRSFL